jgi:hypothetical protein
MGLGRPLHRRVRQNSARFCREQGEKLAVFRAKIEANGCSITVDFSKKGFKSSYTPPRPRASSLGPGRLPQVDGIREQGNQQAFNQFGLPQDLLFNILSQTHECLVQRVILLFIVPLRWVQPVKRVYWAGQCLSGVSAAWVKRIQQDVQWTACLLNGFAKVGKPWSCERCRLAKHCKPSSSLHGGIYGVPCQALPGSIAVMSERRVTPLCGCLEILHIRGFCLVYDPGDLDGWLPMFSPCFPCVNACRIPGSSRCDCHLSTTAYGVPGSPCCSPCPALLCCNAAIRFSIGGWLMNRRATVLLVPPAIPNAARFPGSSALS